MNDFWNDPPEQPEVPMCCEEYMDVTPEGALICKTCGKRIEPQPDEPSIDFGQESFT